MKKTIIALALLFILLPATAQSGKTFHILGKLKFPVQQAWSTFQFSSGPYNFKEIYFQVKSGEIFDFRYKLTTSCDSVRLKILTNIGVYINVAKSLKDTTVDFGLIDNDISAAIINYNQNHCTKLIHFESNSYSKDNSIKSYLWTLDGASASNSDNFYKWFKTAGKHNIKLEMTDNFGKHTISHDIYVGDTCITYNNLVLKFKTKNEAALSGTFYISGYDTFDYKGKSKVYLKKLKPVESNYVMETFQITYKTCNKNEKTVYKYIYWKDGIDTIDLGTLDGCPCNIDFKYNGNDKHQLVEFRNISEADNLYPPKIKWTFGDGDTITKFDGGWPPMIHSYSKKGSYKVKMEYYGGYDCQGSIEKTINYLDTCTTLIYMKDSVDYNETGVIRLRVNYLWPGVDSARWNFGDGQKSKELSTIHHFDSTKTYEVCVKTWEGGCQSSNCINVDIIKVLPCRAYFEIIKDPDNKFGLLLIDKSKTKNAQYTWSTGDGSNYNEKTFEHNYAQFGMYEIKLTIDDSTIQCKSEYFDIITFDSTGKLSKKGGFTLKVIPAALSISMVKQKTPFGIYPVPVESMLNIVSTEIIESIVIYDNMGRNVLKSDTIGSNSVQLDISSLKPGFYILAILSGEDLYQRKIIIK